VPFRSMLVFFLAQWFFPAGAIAEGIHLVEGSLHLRAGGQSTCTLEINASQSTSATEIRWRTQIGSVVVQDASVQAHPSGEGLQTAVVTIEVPTAERRIRMNMTAEYKNAAGEVVRGEFFFRIYPSIEDPDWNELKKLRMGVFGPAHGLNEGKEFRIGVFDPGNQVRPVLTQLGLQQDFLPTASSLEGYEGSLIFIGPGALVSESARRSLRDLLASPFHVPILVLNQEQAQGSPFPSGGIRKSRIISMGHPVFKGMDDLDLCGWRETGFIAHSPLITPTFGNFRPLLVMEDVVTDEADTLLLERLPSMGPRAIFCQLPLFERWEVEPVCPELLFNLLTYLSKSPPVMLSYGAEVYANPTQTAQTLLLKDLFQFDKDWEPAETQPVYADPGYPMVVLFPAGEWLESTLELHPSLLTRLVEWIEQGGEALVVGLDQECMPLLEPLVGTAIKTGETTTSEITLPKPNEPLLWGTRMRDWGVVQRYQKASLFIGEGDKSGWRMLVEPGCLALREMKEGKLVVLNVEVTETPAVELERLTRQILTNIGTRLPYPKAQPLPYSDEKDSGAGGG
jgi:hypothetical protein